MSIFLVVMREGCDDEEKEGDDESNDIQEDAMRLTCIYAPKQKHGDLMTLIICGSDVELIPVHPAILRSGSVAMYRPTGATTKNNQNNSCSSRNC